VRQDDQFKILMGKSIKYEKNQRFVVSQVRKWNDFILLNLGKTNMMPIIEKNLEYILIIIFFIAYFCVYFAIKKKMKIIDKTLNEKYSHNADTIDFTELEEKDQEEQLNYYKYKNFLAFTRY
jgi:hypothetical protein